MPCAIKKTLFSYFGWIVQDSPTDYREVSLSCWVLHGLKRENGGNLEEGRWGGGEDENGSCAKKATLHVRLWDLEPGNPNARDDPKLSTYLPTY